MGLECQKTNAEQKRQSLYLDNKIHQRLSSQLNCHNPPSIQIMLLKYFLSLYFAHAIYSHYSNNKMDKRSFHINHYEYLPHLLYSSRECKVYKAVNSQNHSCVVFKGYPEKVLADTTRQKRLNQELGILWSLSGKTNVLQIISQHVRDKQVFIISQFCQNGNLYDEVKAFGKLREEISIKHIRQIINGYKSIHSAKVIHRNLEAANILIKKQELKIGDFSDAIMISEAAMTAKREQMAGQLLYQAPQTLRNYRYSTKSDIYAIGTLFYFMLQGELPYNGSNKSEVLAQMEKQTVLSKILPSWQSKTQQFLTKTLALNQHQRMGIDELINFDFGLMQHFSQNDYFSLEEEQSVLILNQTQNVHKEGTWLGMDSLRVSDLGIFKDFSTIDIKASQMDIGPTKQGRISIDIPSGVNLQTLKSINLHQDLYKTSDKQGNAIEEKIESDCSSEKQSLERTKKRKNSFRQCLAERMEKKKTTLSKRLQNFQNLQVKIDKSASNNLKISKDYGPITAKGRQNIKASIQNISSTEENGIITNWLLSQIDMVRLLNRVCFRLRKIEPRSENILYKELSGLTSNILKETQDLTLLQPSLAPTFRNSAEHNQLKEIVQAYRSRESSRHSFSSYARLTDLLVEEIDRIYRDTIEMSELSQDHVKTLDFLVTVWQLNKLLKKQDLKLFYQKSKIQLILDGQQSEVKVWHLLQLYDRMKLLKLIK